ncbi:hypothetical protein [Neisseria chenwenguii]|nr:hypothetical protein [Neisseria chenwenguii]
MTLLDIIKYHLRQEFDMKRRMMWLFAPIMALIVYLLHYFGAF